MNGNIIVFRGKSFHATDDGEVALLSSVGSEDGFSRSQIKLRESLITRDHYDGFDLFSVQKGIEAPLKHWPPIQGRQHFVKAHPLASASRDYNCGAAHFLGQRMDWGQGRSIEYEAGRILSQLFHYCLGKGLAVCTSSCLFLQDLHYLSHV